MKCSAFIAISADGNIATADGGVEWLQLAGNSETGDREQFGSGGFEAYIASVDCMIMGRKCMATISSFNLTPEQWPYGELHIIVLSKSVTQAPILLGDGLPLFGKIMESVRLSEAKAKKFSNDFIQWKYKVNYA